MRAFHNARLLTKLALPVTLLAIITVAIAGFAYFGLTQLSGNVARLVEVSSQRQIAVALAGTAINEATILEKNIILETEKAAMSAFEQNYVKAKQRGIDQIDRAIRVSDTEETRAAAETLKRSIENYFKTLDKSVGLAMGGQGEDALVVSSKQGRVARVMARQALQDVLDQAALDLERDKAHSQSLAGWIGITLLAMSAAGLVAGLGIAVAIVVFGVARPLGRITGALDRLAHGDLDVEVVGEERRDEVGALARALGTFRTTAREARERAAAEEIENRAKVERAQRLESLTRAFETTMRGLTGALSTAASELEDTASSMAATADQTNQTSVHVAGAAEQTSSNVQTVAAATEELSASIHEIGNQVSQSARIASRAVTSAETANEMVKGLASGAEKIGTVISLINSIASQTNLLALNATIEAARAGEAGRGFAVVAAEVKELANQTTRATEEISGQVAAIQGAVTEVVSAIREIGSVIGEMSQISTAVAGAVEEQGSATGEISRNVQEAARGTEQVTSSILDVKQGAGATGKAAANVLEAARRLGRQSGDLSQEVERFLSGVKAA